MQTGLYDTCLQAARSGTLNRLVIDEAHLVQTWGAAFRTDFQFLATYRRQLLAASGSALRTILLSATIERSCEELFQRLFAEAGRFNRVDGTRLRPEVSYWFDDAQNVELRRQHVLDALLHLPRPAIVYVARPLDADHWLQEVRRVGFKRAAVFSGATTSANRSQIIDSWNDDRLDLMIATSAFGLGVNKPDIRTVIHASLPENLDRSTKRWGEVAETAAVRSACSARAEAMKTRRLH